MTPDIFNYADRAGFLERLGSLAGKTTYREPGGGGSPYSARMMTTDNAMTLALSFARLDKRDVGPEIVYSIATSCPHRREQVVAWLAIKILRDAGPKGRKAQNHINILAQHCYEMVVFGKQATRLPSRLPVCWDELRNIGIGWLWMQAESTIERAERAYRDESVADRRQTKTPSDAVSTY
jgi:hypothetical protein